MANRIVSISMDEGMYQELEQIGKRLRSGRSSVVRAGLQHLLEEHAGERLAGRRTCILILVHGKGAEAEVTEAKHRYDDIISTQVHNNLPGGKCLELFVLEGEAERIREMANRFRTDRKIAHVKLIVA